MNPAAAGLFSDGSAAAREFARVTRAVVGSAFLDDEAAASGGLLNQNGAPLEFTFGSACGELRYTMEVDAAATAPAGRLRRIDALLAELGVPTACGGVAREFAALQEGADIAWGAWLGARQPYGDAGGGPTRHKVYAELPSGTDDRVAALCARYLGPDSLPAPLIMLGAAPGAERCEFYFEFGRARFALAGLQRLLLRVGLAARFDELVALVGEFQFRRGREPDALPRAQYGFSVSAGPGGREPVFALHTFAADLAGGDAGVRHQVLARARRQGADLHGYAALSAPLAAHHGDTSFHNMLTFSVDEHHPAGWQVSLCPPAERRS